MTEFKVTEVWLCLNINYIVFSCYLQEIFVGKNKRHGSICYSYYLTYTKINPCCLYVEMEVEHTYQLMSSECPMFMLGLNIGKTKYPISCYSSLSTIFYNNKKQFPKTENTDVEKKTCIGGSPFSCYYLTLFDCAKNLFKSNETWPKYLKFF